MNSISKGKNKETLMEYFYAIAGCMIYCVGFNVLIVPMGLTVEDSWVFHSLLTGYL